MNIHFKNIEIQLGSPQFHGGRFKGNLPALTMGPRDWLTSSRRFLFEKNGQVPAGPLPVQQADLSFLNDRANHGLNSTWLGHSSLMINMEGCRILTDPVFETRITPMGPVRFNREFPLDPGQLQDIDLVLISHDHYDHLSRASYAVASPHFRIFFSGDSGYFPGFRQIGERLGPFDMTFLECGAYNELWPFVHMFPEETARAHLDLKGRVLHPIHWGTFNLSLHAWNDPMQRLVRAAGQTGIETATPMAGETFVYGTGSRENPWWTRGGEKERR
jgi:L-ascorbate metabolism protein UlaG (beta-lactamase superfamily)